MKTFQNFDVGRLTSQNHLEPQAQANYDQDLDTGMLINALFAELEAIFPAWERAISPAGSYKSRNDLMGDIKAQWLQGLKENNINTVEQIKVGLRHARRQESRYLPSIGQFISWCKRIEEFAGLPSKEEAFMEALSDGKKSPCVLFALHQIPDVYRFRQMSEPRAWEVWSKAWDSVLDYWLEHRQFPRKYYSNNDEDDRDSKKRTARPATKQEVEAALKDIRQALLR